jgi:hypothetical protein
VRREREGEEESYADLLYLVFSPVMLIYYVV